MISYKHQQIQYSKYILNKEVLLFEDSKHEFKHFKELRIDLILNYICAFLNSNGGTLYIGINDSGVVQGIRLKRRQIDDFQLDLDNSLRHFNPSVLPELVHLQFCQLNVPDLFVIEIEVKAPQTRLLYFTNLKEAYVKRAASINQLKPIEIRYRNTYLLETSSSNDQLSELLKYLMMLIDPQNKLIKTQATELFKNPDIRQVVSRDYHDFTTLLERTENYISLSFKCYNFEATYNLAGEYFKKKYCSTIPVIDKQNYIEKEFQFSTAFNQNGYDMTISFSLGNLAASLEKLPNQASEEDKEKYKEVERQVRLENTKISEVVSQAFSLVRRNFYASPYEQALDSIKAGTPVAPFVLNNRVNETVYVVPLKDQLSVFYEVAFDDEVDRILSQLMITELIDAKRHVQQSPSIVRAKYNSEELTRSFQKIVKKDENKISLISISFFKQQHFENDYTKITTLLQGLRQYIHYHVHASKTYLHMRLIKRIQAFQQTLANCQFQQEKEDNKTGVATNN